MRSLVFGDDRQRERLEAIVHPLVAQETARQALQAQTECRRLIVYDIPLLVESGARWRQRVDRVLVVDCDPATQIERVMRRNGLPREEVERILRAQAPRAQRLGAADIVVANGAGVSLARLQQQVTDWLQRLGL